MPFKMTYQARGGKLVFEAIVRDRFAAWETLAVIQELFEETNCGVCNSDRIRWMTRQHSGRDGQLNTFYEIVCDECGAKLEFAVTRDGTRMFPKRMTKDKVPMDNRGWYVYHAPAETQSQEPARAPESYPDQDPNAYGDQQQPQGDYIPF